MGRSAAASDNILPFFVVPRDLLSFLSAPLRSIDNILCSMRSFRVNVCYSGQTQGTQAGARSATQPRTDVAAGKAAMNYVDLRRGGTTMCGPRRELCPLFNSGQGHGPLAGLLRRRQVRAVKARLI